MLKQEGKGNERGGAGEKGWGLKICGQWKRSERRSVEQMAVVYLKCGDV